MRGPQPGADRGGGARARRRRGDAQPAADETREVAYTLRDLGEDWDDDPARLENVEARLALYRRLAGPVRLHARRARPRLARPGEARRDRADETDLKGLDGPLAEALQRRMPRRPGSRPRAEGRQGVRTGDPDAAQAAGAREGAADRRGRDERLGGDPTSPRPRSPAPTGSSCSSSPTPARPRGRCARSPPAASSRG